MIILTLSEHVLVLCMLALLVRALYHELVNQKMLRKGYISSADLKDRVIRLTPNIDLCKNDPRCYYVRALQDVDTIINEMRGG